MQRWLRRPPGSNWGEFGPDDQIGRLNLITPQRRLAATKEVREGIAFALSLPLDYPGGSLHPAFREPPHLTSTVGMHNLVLAELYNAPGAPDIGNDDAVRLCTQYSTQWDGLCHIGSRFDADNDGIEEIVYYNGFRAEDLISSGDDGNSRALALGVENMAVAALQGRGVLVNLHRVYGEQKVLIDYEQMMSVIDSQQIAIEPGDILCLYTGFGDLLLAMKRCPDVGRLRSSFADIDGRDERLLRWITDSNLAAICSDTQAIEIHPENDRRREGGGSLLPLHQHCLFRLGIPLGELWYFQEIAEWLATHNRTSFLLTAPPLRLPGAVGSPVTPIGTV